VQNQKTAQQHSFSENGLQELTEMHQQLVANLRLGLSVFLSGDAHSARQLLREKRRFRAQERRMAHAHVHRLHHQVVQSIETSSLHLELIADMKRLNSLFCSSAYAALESHEHGTLADGDDDHPEAAEQHATELDSHEAKPAAR
jgi:phosphate:Na+ symporter